MSVATVANDRLYQQDALEPSELVRRALSLTATFAERAAKTEALRQPAPENCVAIKESGIHRISQPARFGGAQGSFRDIVDILSAIGRGCGSTAWVLAQNIAHNFMISNWPGEAQNAVWGKAPDAMLSGILIPGLGKASPAPDGWTVSGRWPFVSGVNVSDWVIFTAFTDAPDGSHEDRHFLVPRSAVTIHDTWEAMGLRGSASNDFEVKDLFVPKSMTVTGRDLLGGGTSPGSQINTALVFQAPCYAMFGIVIGAAGLGIAEAAVSTYVEQTRKRTAAMSGQAVAQYTTQHVKVADAVTSVETARLLMYAVADEAVAILESGRQPTDEERTGFRCRAAFAARLAASAVNTIWDAGGGAGIYERNPLARYFRDISAAGRHITQTWDVNASMFGRVKLGLPHDNTAI